MRHRLVARSLALFLLLAASPAAAQPQRVHGSFAPPRTPADRGVAAPDLWLATAEGFRTLRVEHLTAQESLGGVPTYDVVATAEDPEPSAEDLLGQLVTLGVRVGPNDFRVRSAFVFGLSEMPGRPRPDGTRPRELVLELAPWLAALGRTAHCEVFEQVTAVDVVRAVFGRHDFARADFRVRETLPVLGRVAQYRETDLSFVQRVLADAGLYYYFEHDAHGHTLVVTDGHEHRRRPRELVTLENDGDDPRNAVLGLREHHRITTTGVRGAVRDPDDPRRSRVVEARSGQATPLGELVVTGPFGALDRGTAERQARARLALSRHDGTYSMVTENRRIELGSAFRLRGHPSPGVDGVYRVVDASWSASREARRPNTPLTIHHDLQIQRLGERFYLPPDYGPGIQGAQTATVVGDGRGEPRTDADGRVRVRLHWAPDPSGELPETWVPVVGGRAWRPAGGDVVLVLFLDGDPARPVIWVPPETGATST